MDDIVSRCKKTLEAHYGARFAGLVLYGSMARDEARADSDIDLLVLLNCPVDYFQELCTLTELLYPRDLYMRYPIVQSLIAQFGIDLPEPSSVPFTPME